MIYAPLTKEVMRLCFEAHEGQVDKTGLLYEPSFARRLKHGRRVVDGARIEQCFSFQQTKNYEQMYLFCAIMQLGHHFG